MFNDLGCGWFHCFEGGRRGRVWFFGGVVDVVRRLFGFVIIVVVVGIGIVVGIGRRSFPRSGSGGGVG